MRAEARRLCRLWLAARIFGRVSKRAGGFFAWRLWFTPWHTGTTDAARGREARWLADTSRVSIPFGGASLNAFVAGDGPAVLLVHGWGDHAARLGAFVAPLVEAGFRVVAVDLPAHGASPGRTTNAYEAAAALRAVADSLGGVTAVVAHSMGGAETVLAMQQGLAADRVVLLASAVRLEHAVDVFTVLFDLPPRTIEGLRNAIERRFGSGVWQDLAADLSAADLQVPALIVHDTDDAQVAFSDGEALAGAWPGARFMATSGLGHHRIVRDAAVIAAAVAFLGSAEERSGDRAPVALRLDG